MKQRKTITPYIVILCLASVTLTSCGGDYDITTGKGGAVVSGSAVSGATVSGGAIDEAGEKKSSKDDKETEGSLEQRFLQEMYPYCSSKFAYTGDKGKIWQVSLTDGEKQQEFSVPGMKVKGKYDEEKHPWLEVLYVSDDEIVYEVHKRNGCSEIWSIPLKKQREKEYLDGSQGRKILKVKDDVNTIVYVDENYIAYEGENNGYHEYDRKKKKYIIEGLDQGGNYTAYCGLVPAGRYRKEMILMDYGGAEEWKNEMYYHSVGSETMKLVYQASEETEISYGLVTGENDDEKKIYYWENRLSEDGSSKDYGMYCYDLKTQKTECVVTQKEVKEIVENGYTLEFLYGENSKVYLEFSKWDEDEDDLISCFYSYTKENGLQEEKELNELLPKGCGYVITLSEQYVLFCIEEEERLYVYDRRTGKKKR